MSDILWPRGLEHASLLCPLLSSEVCSNSCPSRQWCYVTISSSAAPFFFCLQSLTASGSFPVSHLIASGGQSIGASASASVLPEYSVLISFRIDWLDLLAVQRTLKSLLQHDNSKASILWCSAFSWGPSAHFSAWLARKIGDIFPSHLQSKSSPPLPMLCLFLLCFTPFRHYYLTLYIFLLYCLSSPLECHNHEDRYFCLFTDVYLVKWSCSVVSDSLQPHGL